MSIGRQIKNGIIWGTLGQFSTQFASFILTIVMARLIAPEYFGKIAMVDTVIALLGLFAGLGFDSSLQQKKEVENNLLSSFFWFNIFLGSLLSIGFFSSGKLIEQFYSEENVSFIVKCLSPVFLLNSIGATHQIIARRRLNFKLISTLRFVNLLIGGTVGLAFAYNRSYLLALIVPRLLQSSLSSLTFFFAIRWKPRLFFSLDNLKDLKNYSGQMLLVMLFNYVFRNMDNILIGKLLGGNSLGLYSKSYSLLRLPINNISGIISTVLFPAFSQIQDNKEQLKSILTKVLGAISFFSFPLMTTLFVATDTIIFLVLGENWMEIVNIVKVFCFLGILQSISSATTVLYKSQGRLGLMLKVGIPLSIPIVLSILIGAQWGILGVAFCYSIAASINAIVNTFFATRLIGLTMSEIGRALMPAFVSSIVMGVVMSFVLNYTDLFSRNWLFVINVIPAGILYIFLFKMLNPKIFNEMSTTISSKIF